MPVLERGSVCVLGKHGNESTPVKSRSLGGDRRQIRANPAELGDTGRSLACDLELDRVST